MVQPATPNPYYRVVHFDVSGVDLTNSTLVKAEFRIFRGPNPEARALEQRVELYQVNPLHEVMLEISPVCKISTGVLLKLLVPLQRAAETPLFPIPL